MTFDKSVTAIKQLTDVHLKRYSNYLEWAESGKPGVNKNETKYYLGIWSSIANKGYEWDKLTTQEQAEIVGALYDTQT
jgi:hypothetical protein